MATANGRVEAGEGIADLGREIANDAVRLVRAEIGLARAELGETLRSLRTAAILFGIAAAALLLLAVAALGTLADALGEHLLGGAWRGWAVLALLFLVVAAALGWWGYRAVRRSIAGTREAVSSLKEDAAWVRLLTRRNGKGS